MTRVLIVLNGVIGGANTSAMDLVRHLPSDRYQGCIAYPHGATAGVDALRASCPRTAAVYLPHWKRLHEPLLRRLREKISRNLRSGFHLRSGLHIRRLCRQWEIALIHTNTSTTLTPALAARAMGLPHVWHIRELIGSGTRFRYLASDRATAHLIAKLSDRIVTNSEQSAEFFRRHLGDEAVTVVPNGLPEPDRDPAEAGAKLRLGLGVPPSAFVIGMAASLGAPVKNHRYVIDAVSPILRGRPDTYFIAYGTVPDTAYARSIRSAVEALGPRARLAGHVPDPWAIMGSLDVLAHGTNNESFGRVFVEAMLAGKPVVTPRGGGALSIVEHGVTGFLTDPARTSDMTGYLERLTVQADLRHRLGDAGRARARSEFTLGAHVRAMCRVYDEVLQARPPALRSRWKSPERLVSL
jgi:glycosyltransferase involved in cell wall biosynthesis